MEADAILLSIYLIHENEDYVMDLNFEAHISSRDVLALHLYILVHNIVVKCFLFVGLNDFVVSLKFFLFVQNVFVFFNVPSLN